jgi:hypothetical protein
MLISCKKRQNGKQADSVDGIILISLNLPSGRGNLTMDKM